MNPKILSVLCCPGCGNTLALESFVDTGAEVTSGVLLCRQCGAYPIRNGIPRFQATCWDESENFSRQFAAKLLHHQPAISTTASEEFLKRSKKTKESFGLEWTRYHFDPRDEGWFTQHFLSCMDLPESWFPGKFLLDIGCGMGRYPRVVSKLGAEIVALELSHAVERVKEICGGSPSVHPVQGDLMRPPFREGAFDLVYSIGVLHHTPDTKNALASIAELPKTGGILAVQVYPKLRLEWLNTWLRAVTLRIPQEALYYLCLALVPVPRIPLLRTLLRPVPHSKARTWRERWNDNFDWYSCEYQYHHTPEEIVEWFRQYAYDRVRVPPKYPVSVTGIRNGRPSLPV